MYFEPCPSQCNHLLLAGIMRRIMLSPLHFSLAPNWTDENAPAWVNLRWFSFNIYFCYFHACSNLNNRIQNFQFQTRHSYMVSVSTPSTSPIGMNVRNNSGFSFHRTWGNNTSKSKANKESWNSSITKSCGIQWNNNK